MKFVSFTYKNNASIGILLDDFVIDIHQATKKSIPNNMLNFLKDFDRNLEISSSIDCESFLLPINKVKINSPIINPNSLRDAYAFRQHVKAGRDSRGLEMIPEYDKFPVFYFSNHNSIVGPGIVEIQNNQMKKLDFELEIAAIIGKRGKNIEVHNADEYIAGYTIMNDFSARELQFEEMKLNLGPAKGKDFATSLGPCLVTKDELSNYKISSKEGDRYDLTMKAFLNGKLISKDNFKNMTWTFAQIISRISDGVEIFPGDVIGSGTCATGCFLELNMYSKNKNWLKNKDIITLEVDYLGVLENTIISI